MAARCGEMKFNLDGQEGYERVQNVPTFRYLVRPLDQTDDDCPAVRRNIMRARLVWGRLGTLLRREWAYPKVSASFYREVVQAIIFYGSEMWVLLASIAKSIEGTHTEFLKIVTGKRAKQLGYGIWESPGTEGIKEAEVTQSDSIYIQQRQATVAHWVALRPLFEVCVRETRHEGGGWRRKVWWRQEATEKQFGPLWKTRRKLKGGGGAVGIWACSRTTTGTESKSGWLIVMLGRRRATPRWVNDLV